MKKFLFLFLISTVFILSPSISFSASTYLKDPIITGTDGIYTDSRSFSTIAAAVAAIGADNQTLLISEPVVSTNLTINANTTLKFIKTGIIVDSATLTINTTNIISEDRQIFTAITDIDFAPGSVVRSSWFTDLNTAIDVTEDNDVTLIISESDTITGTRTVGSDVVLKWEAPGNLITAVGDLEDIKNISAGNYQIFTGAGDLDFLDGTRLKLSWFDHLRAVLTWIEDEEVTIVVSGTNTVNFTDTATINEFFDFSSEQGQFTISGGIILTIHSPSNIIAQSNQQIFSGAGNSAFTGGAGAQEIYPEWWGSFPDLVTDTSVAFNKAINLGIKVKLGSGTYLVNAVHTTGYLVIEGMGNDVTFLKSYSATGWAFSEELTSTSWIRHLVMSDLGITGSVGQTRNGFSFGGVTYATNLEYAGRVELNRVSFTYLDYAFYKYFGNIGNVLNGCTFSQTNFSYYATWDTVHLMHAGADTFNNCHFDNTVLAAVFIDSTYDAAGQTVFNSCVFENNPGFAFFISNYIGATTPLAINDTWFENNATSVTVTIHAVVYTPRYLYIRNTNYATITRCGLISSVEYINSSVRETDCSYYVGSSIVDSDSVRILDNINTSYARNQLGAIVNSYSNNNGGGTLATGECFTIPPRISKVFNYTSSFSESFSGAGAWPFTGTAAINATTVADGLIYANCATITVPTAHTEYLTASTFTYTSGKWYAYSMDVKLMTVLRPTQNIFSGWTYNDAAESLVKDKWITIGGIQLASATSTMSIPTIVNTSGGDVTLRMSALQVIEFGTKMEAVRYFNERLYQSE
ncbi:MAG: hypothetical protein KKH70_20840 [Gammaproteobacteria bacterium]|uniref:Putative tail fiber protein n=1 Tax=viral metagenome TaxID=1070528 RepID=A0A6M3IJ87_9ZZZZ|nr:hypothetical protein [Gammaproteobacteria bacterium]